MRCLPYILLAALLAVFSLESRAQTSVEQAVVSFGSLVRDYNVITAGNLTLNQTHTDGAIAVGGNLTTSGSDIVLHANTLNASDPALYVAGQISMSNESKLLAGYAYAPNLNSSVTWTNTGGQRWLQNGSGGKLWFNTSDSRAYVDPRTTTSSSFNLNSAVANLTSVSSTLAGASSTGTINFSNNQIVLSTSLTSGVVVFSVDANQLASLSNLNVQINVPENMVYVINVTNANGQTLFGGGGNNGNSGGNNDQLLWNIIPAAGATNATVTLGTNFYGSILAPLVNINSDGKYVNGQVVANNYTQNNAEIHHVKFDSSSVTFSSVPEPGTWGVFGVASCAFMMLFGRRRRRA